MNPGATDLPKRDGSKTQIFGDSNVRMYRQYGVRVHDGLGGLIDGYWCDVWRKWLADHLLVPHVGKDGRSLFAYLEALPEAAFDEHLAALSSALMLGSITDARRLVLAWLWELKAP